MECRKQKIIPRKGVRIQFAHVVMGKVELMGYWGILFCNTFSTKCWISRGEEVDYIVFEKVWVGAPSYRSPHNMCHLFAR